MYFVQMIYCDRDTTKHWYFKIIHSLIHCTESANCDHCPSLIAQSIDFNLEKCTRILLNSIHMYCVVCRCQYMSVDTDSRTCMYVTVASRKSLLQNVVKVVIYICKNTDQQQCYSWLVLLFYDQLACNMI